MKKMFLLSGFALLFTSLALAQDTYPQTSGQQNTSNTPVSAGPVQGCLSGSDGNYMLAQDSTGTTFKLIGADDQLKKHVGHEVAVTGQMTNGAASASDQGQGSPSMGSSDANSGAMNVVQVSDVKMVSKHCNTGK